MALTQVLLAPTVDESVNVVVINVPAGSTATVAAYTAEGGTLPDVSGTIEVTHKNPAGTFQSTGFWIGISSRDQQMSQYILGPGAWSVNKAKTSVPVGLMLDS
jgi:outer membrane protein assembly factor BamA